MGLDSSEGNPPSDSRPHFASLRTLATSGFALAGRGHISAACSQRSGRPVWASLTRIDSNWPKLALTGQTAQTAQIHPLGGRNGPKWPKQPKRAKSGPNWPNWPNSMLNPPLELAGGRPCHSLAKARLWLRALASSHGTGRLSEAVRTAL